MTAEIIYFFDDLIWCIKKFGEFLDAPKYDAALDVFSFGVVMLHTLTKKWPEPSATHISASGVYKQLDEIEYWRVSQYD